MDSSDFLATTRTGYDRTARLYAERFHTHLDDKPLDRAILRAFAELVAATENPRVADLGCGTGATTKILHDSGVEAFGIDLSPQMLEEAHRLNPELTFQVGSMTDLDIADASVGGVCAWYSIIHIPDDHLDRVIDEFARILAPGGLVLLAYQIGDKPRVLHEAFGEPVELTFYRRRPENLLSRLERADLRRYAELVREPDLDGFESTPHEFLIAQKIADGPAP